MLPEAPHLVQMEDQRFDSVFQEWSFNITRGIYQLHQNPYFVEHSMIFAFSGYELDRELTVTTDVKKMLRKYKNTDITTVMLGYDSNYLKSEVLEAILSKFRTKRAFKRVDFSQISAEKITKYVDTLLHRDYYIPDLIFVTMQINDTTP